MTSTKRAAAGEIKDDGSPAKRRRVDASAREVKFRTAGGCVVCRTKYAQFGLPGGRRRRCLHHKLPDDVNLTGRRCVESGCAKFASYGATAGGGLRHCADHREPADVATQYRMCVTPGCKKVASFGPPGGRRTHCGVHRGTDDVNLIAAARRTSPAPAAVMLF